jgi:hypothetical protein
MIDYFFLVWVGCRGSITVYKIPLEQEERFKKVQKDSNQVDLLLNYTEGIDYLVVDTKLPVTLNGLVMFVSG